MNRLERALKEVDLEIQQRNNSNGHQIGYQTGLQRFMRRFPNWEQIKQFYRDYISVESLSDESDKRYK